MLQRGWSVLNGVLCRRPGAAVAGNICPWQGEYTWQSKNHGLDFFGTSSADVLQEFLFRRHKASSVIQGSAMLMVGGWPDLELSQSLWLCWLVLQDPGTQRWKWIFLKTARLGGSWADLPAAQNAFTLTLGEGIVPKQPCSRLSSCLAIHRINFLMKSFYYTI